MLDKVRSVTGNIKCGWFSIVITVIFASLYINISSFTILGLLGFIALNLLFFIQIESIISKDYKIVLKRKYTVVLACVGIVYLVLSIISEKLADNVITLSILAIAVVVITGLAFADGLKSKNSKLFVALASFGLLFFSIYLIFTVGVFSPDSAMYYDISKTTFGDYGNTGIIRQYVVDSIYNCSFPYFYPLCIFVVDKLTGLGRYSGVFIDVYAMIFTMFLTMRLSKRITGNTYSGIIAFVVMATSPFYLDEVCGGRTIPVSLLFIVIILSYFYTLFTSEEDKVTRAPVLGLVIGLAVVTRFDNLPLTAYCLLVLLFISRKKIRDVILYCAGILVSVSPWVIYSLVRFHKIWITDNSGTLFLVKYALPTRVDLPGEKAQTLFSDPGLWFTSLLTTKTLIIFGLIICSIAGFICFLFCCFWLFKSIKDKTATFKNSRMMLIVLLFYFLKSCMYVVVGYPEERYHLETIFVMTFVLLAFCVNRRKKINLTPVSISVVPATILTLVVYIAFYGSLGFPDRTADMVSSIKNGDLGCIMSNSVLSRVDEPEEEIDELNMALKDLLKDDEAVLVVESYFDLEVWADYKVYAHPYPNNSDTIEYVVSTHDDISYVVAKDEDADIEFFASKYPCRPVGEYYIFAVRASK
ncbi:MAG: glycosyltransferase family 39 protein [Clostridiales bacterium]|nr:glycosyltransferase family 39 protein [Clostridiales bacterium]